MKYHTQAIARRFAFLLENPNLITPLWAIDQMNADEDPSVDHAHDHCDANELLAGAFHEVTGVEFNPQDPEHSDTWEAVWGHCREVGYVKLYEEATSDLPATLKIHDHVIHQTAPVDRLPAFLEWLRKDMEECPYGLCEFDRQTGQCHPSRHHDEEIIEAFTRATTKH